MCPVQTVTHLSGRSHEDIEAAVIEGLSTV